MAPVHGALKQIHLARVGGVVAALNADRFGSRQNALVEAGINYRTFEVVLIEQVLNAADLFRSRFGIVFPPETADLNPRESVALHDLQRLLEILREAVADGCQLKAARWRCG